MSFLFASSHLPEVKRPEEDEEEDNLQPMRWSGSVRAFSHLPQRVQGEPAAPTVRPFWATEPEAHSDHEPEADGFSTEPRQPEDNRPWYLPRITPEDLHFMGDNYNPDPGFSILPEKPVHDYKAEPGFSVHPSKAWGKPTPDSGFDLRPQDIHDATGDPAPRSKGLPYGRLFEKRLPPGFQNPAASQLRDLTDKGEFHDLVYRTQDRPSSPPQFQTVAALNPSPGQTKVPPVRPSTPGSKNPTKPSLPKRDTPKPDTGSVPSPSEPGSKNGTKELPPQQKPNPAPAPPTQGPPPSPSTTGSQNKQSNMTIDDDKNSPFAATVQSALDREMKDSPASAALFKAVNGLPNKIKIVPKIAGEAKTTLQADGTIVISVNTRNMTSATMSHELSHAIQQAVYHNTLKELAQKGEDPKKKETIDKAVQTGRDALHQVLPLQNKSDQGQEFKENEAMRAGHIVNAERTAAEIKTKIGDTSSMSPDEIAEMFWKEQLKKEDSMHANNHLIIPKGTKYGNYDYAPVLKSLGNGVTREHLENARKKLIPSGW